MRGLSSARSLLFVPGDRPDRFDKARASGADVVVLDLEDSVAEDRKSAALDAILTWIASGHDAVVRINPGGTPHQKVELQALASSDVTAVMVPKADSAEELAMIGTLLGPVDVIALLETADGIENARAVCEVPCVSRVAFGHIDLAAQVGLDPDSPEAMTYARSRIALASAAAGLPAPVDGVTTDVDGLDALRGDLAVTRRFGFGGKLCIHPRQVPHVNAALSPTSSEIRWAEEVVASLQGDAGVAVLHGSMVDAPVERRARDILRRAELHNADVS